MKIALEKFIKEREDKLKEFKELLQMSKEHNDPYEELERIVKFIEDELKEIKAVLEDLQENE